MDLTKSVESEEVNLKRNVGLVTGCSLIIGGIIGSGIFVSPQGVLIGAGSYGLSLVIWATCGVISLCGALTFAEIGTLIPKSGSAYYPIKTIYGDCAGFVYVFCVLFFILPAGIAIVTMTCAEYLLSLFFNDGCGSSPSSLTQGIATTLILFIGAINARSVTLSGNISVIFTAAKVSALVVIIIGGLIYLSKGITDYLHPDNSFTDTSTSVASLAESFLSGMWAYTGWENLNFMIEELKDPNRNLPRAIFISVPVVTVIYILTNVAYFSVLSPEQILETTAVAMTWANEVIPTVSWFVPLAVAISTFGASSGALLLNSRLAYVAARENHLPNMFVMVNVFKYTPTPAVILLTILSCVYVYTGTIVELIGYTGVLTWMIYGMIALGLFILRYKHGDLHRPYKAPLICPALLILFAILLSLGPIIGNPQWGYFFSICVILLGIIFWVVFIYFKINIPGMDNITVLVQLFLKVTSPELSETSDSLANSLNEDVKNYNKEDLVGPSPHYENLEDEKRKMPTNETSQTDYQKLVKPKSSTNLDDPSAHYESVPDSSETELSTKL